MQIRSDGIFEAFDAALQLVNDQEREQLSRILDASRDSVQRAVHDLVQEVVDEVNQTGALRASLVYRPDGLELELDPTAAGPTASAPPDIELDFDASEIERLTLRLPAELKEIAASAADQAGVSLNAWLTRLVTQEAGRDQRRSHGGRRHDHGQRLRGWIDG